MARVKRVLVNFNQFENLITQGHKVVVECTNGIPETAGIVDIRYDEDRLSLFLIVQDDSFDDIPEGETVPLLRPTFDGLSAKELIQRAYQLL